MKFTKMTSALVAGATLLAGLAIAAPAATQAATVQGNAGVNGGQALPQDAKTTAGISFGQLPPTGNTGYLRLQMVPKILDFGNHEQFFQITRFSLLTDKTQGGLTILAIQVIRAVIQT